VRSKLQATCLKNSVLYKENTHLNQMYTAAVKRDTFDA